MSALTRNGIPYHFHGPGSLYKQPEIKDLIAYLNVVANPEDSVSFYRVLSMKIFAVHPQDISYLLAFSKKTATTLLRAAEIVVYLSTGGAPVTEFDIYRPHLPYLREDTRQKLYKIFTIIQKATKDIRRLNAGQILYTFLEDSGYLLTLGTITNEKEERAALLISKFFDKIKAFESTHEDASLHSFADYIALSMELGESPATADLDEPEYNAVNILTVHGSKGLEFPVVFLVNLSTDRFPTRARREVIPIPAELIKEVLPQGDYHIEEERRLFYVAMTRAKDNLFLSTSRYYGEGKRIKKVSPFVYEALGDELVEKQLNIKVEEKQQLSIFDFKPIDEETSSKSETLLPINRPMYVSYSQMDTFERCALQYKYQYILKIPAPANGAASYGSSVHNALQIFYQMYKVDRTIGLPELLEQFNRAWIPLGYASQSHEKRMKKVGEEMLTAFFNEYHTPNITVIDLEKLFRLKISDKVFVSGKIDRVDQNPDGSIEIIDYKTGKKPDEKELKDSIQLATYLMAAAEKSLYNKAAADVTLTFYYLQDNSKISMKKTQEDIIKTKERIMATTAKMANSSYPPTVGPQCGFCPFKMICEAWQ
ncbi:ATP-dependent helicase [Candidatus Microgenomates bacterium]|nr:ATP-dependent helicase [Candidatus Microgenomates bacterium]